MKRETLFYVGTKAIEQYITDHPIDWSNKALACRGGIGDQAGMSPTPMVYEFLALYRKKQALFTQKEYQLHCFQEWRNWGALTDTNFIAGVKAKLYRNAYPSMIDSLHVYSLLVEAGWFDKCVLDSVTDALSKHDLLVFRGSLPPIALDLYSGSRTARSDRQYKQIQRPALSGEVCRTYEVPLSLGRPMKQPGNKRWYCLKDFDPVYVDLFSEEGTVWGTFLVPCTCGWHRPVRRVS